MTSVNLLVGHSGDCELSAQGWLAWTKRLHGHPAMIDTWPQYWHAVGTKGRNMIRKCSSLGYDFGVFDYNSYLDDMHDINTSVAVRGGQPMTESYKVRPRPSLSLPPACSRHTVLWVGGFLDGKLRAYCQLYTCGELAIINRILGHGDALPDGVMNGLMFKLVQTADVHKCRYLNYLTMQSSTNGLEAFKRHVGFRSMEVTFTL